MISEFKTISFPRKKINSISKKTRLTSWQLFLFFLNCIKTFSPNYHWIWSLFNLVTKLNANKIFNNFWFPSFRQKRKLVTHTCLLKKFADAVKYIFSKANSDLAKLFHLLLNQLLLKVYEKWNLSCSDL